jgi:hypothetical protein
VEGSPIVLKAEGNALVTHGAGLAGEPPTHTSSMMAISALSPRRRTVRMMRV